MFPPLVWNYWALLISAFCGLCCSELAGDSRAVLRLTRRLRLKSRDSHLSQGSDHVPWLLSFFSTLSSILSIPSVFIFCLHTLAWFLLLGPTIEWNKCDKRARQEIHEILGGVQIFSLGISRSWVHAKSLQSCLTLCNPMDCIPPGSSVHGFLHARILKWVAMPSSRRSSLFRNWTHVSYSVLHWQEGSLPLVLPGKPHQHIRGS